MGASYLIIWANGSFSFSKKETNADWWMSYYTNPSVPYWKAPASWAATSMRLPICLEPSASLSWVMRGSWLKIISISHSSVDIFGVLLHVHQSSYVLFWPNGPIGDSDLIKLANGSVSFGQNKTDNDWWTRYCLWLNSCVLFQFTFSSLSVHFIVKKRMPRECEIWRFLSSESEPNWGGRDY